MKTPPISQSSIPRTEDMQITLTAKKKGNINKPWVSATFYIPRPTHKRLRDHASAHDTSLQQILEEATDMWLASKQEQPFYPAGWSDEIGKKDTIE